MAEVDAEATMARWREYTGGGVCTGENNDQLVCRAYL
jgi:hypothetical protein